MRKFVNDPKQFVPEMLKGIALANRAELRYVPEYNLIMRVDAPSDRKVSIVQGSGSGHEPAHVMLVGKGMLDALVPAIDRLEADLAAGGAEALANAAQVAERAAAETSGMLAKRGRASYTGERSIGSPDPGAVAIGVIASRVSAAWREYCSAKE